MKGAPAWWGDDDGKGKKKGKLDASKVEITDGTGDNVEDFVPDGGLGDDFFGDADGKNAPVAAGVEESRYARVQFGAWCLHDYARLGS